MEHILSAENFGVRLRPVRIGDAAFIVWLRNQEHAKGRVGDSEVDIAGQKEWLKAYFQREGDYYFIIETQRSIPVGAYGIYDRRGTTAESGRWIIRLEVPAAIPSTILAFEIAFEKLYLTELKCATVSTNKSALSLNLKCGFRETGVSPGARLINGHPVDLVHFLLTPEEWQKRRGRLLPLAQLAERQVREWEKAQSQQPLC